MKRFVKVTSALFLLAVILAGATFTIRSTEAKSKASVDCPKSFAEWKNWRKEAVEAALDSQFTSGINGIQAKLTMCRESLDALGKKAQCFSNVDKFSRQIYRTHIAGNSLGLSLTDAAYFETLKKENIGSLPEPYLTNAFLKKLDDAPQEKWPELAEELQAMGPAGTLAFPYTSKHLDSVDDASVKGRLFVYIPGESKDIFTQYAIGKGKKGKLPNAISVITVVKKDSDGQLLSKPKVYFNDLWRERGETISITNRINANKRMENCYSCHKSPLIPINPDETKFDFAAFGQTLAAANSIMSSYSHSEYVGIDEENYGPAFGVNDISRVQCSSAKSVPENARADFNCADCHNGKDRGILNFPTGLDLQLPGSTSLAKLFVKHYGIMPPMHEDLTIEERGAAMECLVEDYYGDFKDVTKGRFNQWLMQPECG